MSLGKQCERGQAIVMMTFATFFMFGIIALVVDLGWAHFRHQAEQSAADAAASAAVGVAIANAWGTCGGALFCSPETPVACPATPPATPANNFDWACYYAAQNGFTTKGNQVVNVYADVGNPPHLNGVQATYWVKVVISETSASFFGPLVGNALNPAAAAMAAMEGVANISQLQNESQPCIDILDPNGSQALKIGGGANINLQCGIWDNSTSTDCMPGTPGFGGAMYVTGASTVSAASANIVGQDCIDAGSTLSVPNSQVVTGADPVPDPFNNMNLQIQPPNYSNCQPLTGQGSTWDASPGCYSSFTVPNGVLVNLSSGVYTINGSSFDIQGSIVGPQTGVMFYLTNGATVNVESGAGVTLYAPALPLYTGGWRGILFYQDPSDTNTLQFSGGALNFMRGSIYAPSALVQISNGLKPSELAVVAKDVDFEGGTYTIEPDVGGNGTGINSGPGGLGYPVYQIAMIQ